MRKAVRDIKKPNGTGIEPADLVDRLGALDLPIDDSEATAEETET